MTLDIVAGETEITTYSTEQPAHFVGSINSTQALTLQLTITFECNGMQSAHFPTAHGKLQLITICNDKGDLTSHLVK